MHDRLFVVQNNPWAVHRFPHPMSAWWIPLLVALGLGPLLIADSLFGHHLPGGNHLLFLVPRNVSRFDTAWATWMGIPCYMLISVSSLVQFFRLFQYFRRHPLKYFQGRISN